MQVTRASEYAMLGLLALARRPAGEVALLDVVAQEEDLPVSFLGKIFQSLARAGLVKSSRGSGGGFVIVRRPEDITVLTVIEAVEGPVALTRCLDEEAGCEHAGGCALCSLFAEAQDKVKEVFAGTTVAQLATRHIPAGLVKRAQERARTPIVFRPQKTDPMAEPTALGVAAALPDFEPETSN
ncbi:MAG TPA: Rrf2 family transcriptional regulator [Candidatus Limnocylindria bacterium]|nr:Rrf2 family transcriptional regulator [Candidatus Limnocylindria bacterium]